MNGRVIMILVFYRPQFRHTNDNPPSAMAVQIANFENNYKLKYLHNVHVESTKLFCC